MQPHCVVTGRPRPLMALPPPPSYPLSSAPRPHANPGVPNSPWLPPPPSYPPKFCPMASCNPWRPQLPMAATPSLLPPTFCLMAPREPWGPQLPMAATPSLLPPPSSAPWPHATPGDPNSPWIWDPTPPLPASSRPPPHPPTHPAVDVQLCGLPPAHPTPQPFPQQLGIVAHAALIQTQLPRPPSPMGGLRGGIDRIFRADAAAV